MANYSTCGIDCDICRYKADNGCEGCKSNMGKVFWGECDLYKCCKLKDSEHCGLCSDFPCATLQEWASTENPERISNIKKMIE